MKNLEKNLNALVVIILSSVMAGAFGVQLFLKEEPCPLCLLQRLGMIAVGASLLLNVKFSVKASHYGLALLSALMGGFVALRQISLHVCPSFSQFGIPVLGLSLYTWSFLVFVCTVLAIALLLFLYREGDGIEDGRMNGWCRFSLGYLLIVALANIVSTFFQCGLGSC